MSAFPFSTVRLTKNNLIQIALEFNVDNKILTSSCTALSYVGSTYEVFFFSLEVT